MPWSTSKQQVAYQSYAGQSLLAGASAPQSSEAVAAEEPREIWQGPLRQREGLFSTFVHSQDPRDAQLRPQCKIIHYDFDAVCRWGGVLGFFTRAGVMRISWSLVVCLGFTLSLALGTGVLVSWHNEEEDMDTSAMDTLQQRVNIMVTFILGFFVQLNISRWWNHREYLRQLQGSLADVLLLLASSGLPREQLRTVARLGLLSQALLFEEARGAFDRPDPAAAAGEGSAQAVTIAAPYVGLMKLGLLHGDEVAYLDGKAQKAQLVWVWIASYVTSIVKPRGTFDHSTKAFKLQKRCCLGRAAVSGIRAQLGTQLPYNYVQLVSMLVQCSHFVMGLGCGYTGAAAFGTGKYALLVAQVAQAILVPLTFQALLDVCAAVSDPYGSDVVDFSFLQQHVSLAKACESFISAVPPGLVRSQEEHAPASSGVHARAEAMK